MKNEEGNHRLFGLRMPSLISLILFLCFAVLLFFMQLRVERLERIIQIEKVILK